MAIAHSRAIDLKAFRSYSEHDVVNGLYSATTIPLYKGSFVTVTVASGNPNVNLTGTGLSPVTPFVGALGNWGNAPVYATSLRFGIGGNKVRAANSGEVVLGMTLVDCVENDDYGVNYAYQGRDKRNEAQVVLSGEGLKIVTKGIFSVNNITGVAAFNSGAYVNNGSLVPCVYNKTLFPGIVGKFLEGADADGYALFKLEL